MFLLSPAKMWPFMLRKVSSFILRQVTPPLHAAPMRHGLTGLRLFMLVVQPYAVELCRPPLTLVLPRCRPSCLAQLHRLAARVCMMSSMHACMQHACMRA